MQKQQEKYVPALGFDWLTRFYDPVLRWTLREETFKRALIAQAGIEPGQDVLDLGRGTGTLTLMIKETQPQADVVGLDGDPKILRLAREKADRARLDIQWDHGMAFELPYPDASFDRVVSSLMLHHLNRENKRASLREALRVLRPGGELHVADWGKPHNALLHVSAFFVALLDGFSRDNVEGRLPELFRAAGFIEVREPASLATLFGTLALFSARKPPKITSRPSTSL